MDTTPAVTVIRADLADLVAAAFYRIGYRPRECLLLVGLRGSRRRLSVVLRVDLEPVRQRAKEIDRMLRLVRRERCDGVVALVVSDAEPSPDSPGPVRLPHRALVRDLRRQASRLRLDVVEVLAVGAEAWWSYSCREEGCCPPGGRSLADALAGPAATELIALGKVLAPDEPSLVADVAPVPPAPGPPGPRTSPDLSARVPAAAPADPQQALARWRELLSRPEAAGPDDARWLVDALEDRWLRDAILVTLIPDSGTVAEEVLAGADCACMDGVFDADPDPGLLERGRVLLSAVARSAPPGRRADALALLAWSAWWSGNGTRGRLLAQRALDDRPAHRLARLVDQLLRLAVAPEWVERRRREEAATVEGELPGCSERVSPPEEPSGS